MSRPFRRTRPSLRTSACAVVSALTALALLPAVPALAAGGGEGARPLATTGNRDYPQSTRTGSLENHRRTQEAHNASLRPGEYGRFTDYFPSPDFGVHTAQLPTGKILLFSFERVETNPNKETAPTFVIGEANAGRAYLWDPEKGTGADAFEAVPPPRVTMPDGLDEERPAPFFCAGHSFLPNGMLGVFGGNLGSNHGSGAKLSLIFDPWTETWSRNQDLSVGRWYPSVVTGADGRQLIFSGQSELGWGTPTPVVERFPARTHAVPESPGFRPQRTPVDTFGAEAPFTHDYPQTFALRDGMIYGLGRDHDEQWTFDPATEKRTALPDRPDGFERLYGSAVPLPDGLRGPDSVLLLGGNAKDADTWEFTGSRWKKAEPRNFGRTQDDTVILPDGNLLTVNGAPGIRDYGNGDYNPNPNPENPDYRQVELRDEDGTWRLGPKQRLPRGYHSNAVVMPDGRVMVTGDELQQLANDPDISDDMNGSIEIYEPPYLHQGEERPDLSGVPEGGIEYRERFTVSTTTPGEIDRAVVLAPTASTHSINTTQRHLDLRITRTEGDSLQLQAPRSAADAIPGYYMLFLLDANGVPSQAQWVKFGPPVDS